MSPSQIAEQRYANCMLVAFLQFTIWKKYFGVQIVGAKSYRHFFTILPLANDTYLRLDGIPELLKNQKNEPITALTNIIQNDYKDNWFKVGQFESLFTASIYSYEALNENLDFYQKVELNKESLKLDPMNLNTISNLAGLYHINLTESVKLFGNLENALFEIERLYKQVLKYDSNYPDIKDNLIGLYYNNLDEFEIIFGSKVNVLIEIERLLIESLKQDPKNLNNIYLLSNMDKILKYFRLIM